VLQVAGDVVKAALVPGSLFFLLLGLALGVALLYGRRTEPWGRRWLLALLLVYVALATPAVSDLLQRERGQSFHPLGSPADAKGAVAVVVLGNGALTYTDGLSQVPAITRRTAFNVMEGARLYRLLGKPRLILSGGIVNTEIQKQSEAELMAETMERLGIPRRAMELEASSHNTYEQSVRVAALVPRGSTVVVVTTPIHMSRTLELFSARGLKPVPSPCRIDYGPEPSSSALARVVPNAASLRASELALYEYLAVANGWARGWLSRADALQ
jgi:uncharacterized SAM-binding protein YcdF (DUF218 family)